jgi:predicted nucleic acid-binding protein
MAITAVDSSVVLDVFSGDPHFGPASKAALEAALQTGTLVACPVVWAELRAHFGDQKSFAAAVAAAEIHFDPFDQECSELAGDVWRAYRRRGGTRTQLGSDFLVGAHARRRAERLLSRDRGFLRSYFKDLVLVVPSKDKKHR